MSAFNSNYPNLADLAYNTNFISDEINQIADLLDTHPNGAQAAADTRHILELAERLEDVWAQAAGVDANKYDPEDLTEALEGYNTAGPSATESPDD
jgi:hypothetical protein